MRYADDIVVGFQRRADAERFLDELRQRLERFGLELHPEKTRLIEFGRFAAQQPQGAGLGKPETFDFLGFTHICGTSKAGRFIILRHTIRQADAGQAPAGQGGDEADDAPADPGAGALPEAGGERLSSTTSPCRPTAGRSSRSTTMSAGTGAARCGAEARQAG